MNDYRDYMSSISRLGMKIRFRARVLNQYAHNASTTEENYHWVGLRSNKVPLSSKLTA